MPYESDIGFPEVTIAGTATVSNAAYLNKLRLAGIVLSAAFDGTLIRFQVSHDGATYQELFWEGAAYEVTVAASKSVSLEPAAFWAWQYVKVVAVTAQTGDSVLQLISRPL